MVAGGLHCALEAAGHDGVAQCVPGAALGQILLQGKGRYFEWQAGFCGRCGELWMGAKRAAMAAVVVVVLVFIVK